MARSSRTPPVPANAGPEGAEKPLSAELVLPAGVSVLFRASIIIFAAFWVYSPVFHGGWLWDDDWYITNQPLLRDGSGLWKFWFRPGSWVEYYPIEETLLWIQWQLFGMDTLGYHLTTIGFHVLDSLLVWRLLAKLGLRKAWLGGLLFAVHPACVDSVAWISEVKNTLSLVPFLLAMCAWIDYEERQSPRDYGLALGFFLIAMLCKITMAPFFAVILLYAWWKRRRISRGDWIAATPFAMISFVLGWLTIACGAWYYRDHLRLVEEAPLGGFFLRLALAGQSLAVYFAHCFWPVQLLPIYPKWHVDPSAPLQFLPWLILAGVISWLWHKRKSWGRHVVLGLGFFAIFLAPFLGFLRVSYMTSTWIMDHFLYIPLIGIVGLIVAAIGSLEERIPAAKRIAFTGLITAVVALLAFEAHAYAGVFTDEESLWGYTLEHYPNSWLAHYNLGNALFESGKIPEAIEEYERALAINPRDAMAHNNLGIALAQTGELAQAREQFEAALRIVPALSSSQNNLAKVRTLQKAAPATN
jgi:tetratricopeptide (TPR) repeat protein